MSKYWVVVPVLSMVLAGCSITQNAANTVEQKAVEQAVKTNCKYDKDVCDYFAASAKSMANAVTMTMTYDEKEKALAGMQTVTKMDGKGNIQSVSSKNGKEESNMIVFNNATYSKDYTDNKWFKMSSGKDDDSVFNMKGMIDEMKDIFSEENLNLSVNKVGQEGCPSVTGLQCVIYEMIDNDNKEFGKTKVWIDTKDHLARKMQVISDNSTSTIAYTYEPVTISEPSPVKEMPTMPPEVEDKMPSQEDIQKMMEQFKQQAPEGE